MNDDAELLRRFAEESSEAAFRELVAQRIDFVYAAALRQVGGDAHLAQEVAQGVFLDVARKARVLARRGTVTGWLYTSVRFAAAKALRSRARRLNHETEAHAMQEILSAQSGLPAGAPDWNELRPVLDTAMHELAEPDREAILLRYFEGRSLAEVGAAIGLAENSARMRVDRALEKLRGRLARRGITSTAAALGVTLAAQPAVALPAGFAAGVAGASLAGAAVAGAGAFAAGSSFLALMGTTKLVVGAAAVIAVGALGVYWGTSHPGNGAPSSIVAPTEAESSQLMSLREENRRLRADLASAAAKAETGGRTASAVAISATGAPATSLDSLRVLLDLQRRKLATPEVKFVADGGRLTAQFAELFALRAGEREALQRSLDATRARLDALRQENTAVERKPNGEITLTARAFPETGGAAYDAMMKEFAATLGTERHNAFLALGGEQMEEALDRFGTSHGTVTISRQTGSDGAARYRIRSETNVTPEDNSNYLSDWMTYDRLVAEAGWLSNVLPPDFAPRR